MADYTSADEVKLSLIQWLYQHVTSVSLSLEVAFPSLAATPGQQGCTWAATIGIIFAF